MDFTVKIKLATIIRVSVKVVLSIKELSVKEKGASSGGERPKLSKLKLVHQIRFVQRSNRPHLLNFILCT